MARIFNDFPEDRQPRSAELLDGPFQLSIDEDERVQALSGKWQEALIASKISVILRELVTCPEPMSFLQLQLLAPGHFAYVRQAVKLLISTGIVKAVPDDRETRYPRYVLAVGFQDVSLDVETE